jgi:ubiquinone/menaquinone biosynthesis C-methylase UbiE
MMNEQATIYTTNEAAQAFNKQSSLFDALYSGNTIVQYKRKRVRDHVMNLVPRGSHILELNAGTGEDAVFFAQQGYHVHATDISTGMQAILQKKVKEHGVGQQVSTELCSFTELYRLQQKGPYDMIFSNLAGLNCTGRLDEVLNSFAPLLKPGGIITLVILPPFCLWETLMVLKGDTKTAFRRFFSKNGVKAHIEGHYFTCWYYRPSFVHKTLKEQYTLLGVEGLCTMVPPSYLDTFPQKYPRLYRLLTRLENKWKSSWPWRNIGDYFIISMQKKSG